MNRAEVLVEPEWSLWQRVKAFVEERGPVRTMLLLFALLLLVFSGVSIMSTPKHEVIYGRGEILVPAVTNQALAIYTLEVGNTGRMVQSNVTVMLRAEPLQYALLQPEFKTFGVSPRAVTTNRTDAVVGYGIGRLEPGDRVKMTVLISRKGGGYYTKDEIFAGVRPEQGEAKVGDPASTQFARFIFKVFGDILPF